mmetsp:Transcript_18395/g.29933  ORF Transcript_18395/g.29933 Transcript_18395/m.29933 type:complete len:184 (-) Transcript_18395:1451-2002(-)
MSGVGVGIRALLSSAVIGGATYSTLLVMSIGGMPGETLDVMDLGERTQGDARLKSLYRLQMEMYRGQKRDARVATVYSKDATLETPLVSLHGPEEIAHFARWLTTTKPVQLEHTCQYYEKGMVIKHIGEYTYMGTHVVPSLIKVRLDDQGKIEHHEEIWKGATIGGPCALTRRFNGWLMSKYY